VSDAVITRVVAIEEAPPGSPATRRLIAEWSDDTQAEALAWFSDLWLACTSARQEACSPSNPRPASSNGRPDRRCTLQG
jgi:hypothetical protein